MPYFRCAECNGNGFLNTDDLETHIVKEHYGGRCFYECTEPSCGACFHTARRLLRHYVTIHNYREDNSETSIKLSISNALTNSINSSFVYFMESQNRVASASSQNAIEHQEGPKSIQYHSDASTSCNMLVPFSRELSERVDMGPSHFQSIEQMECDLNDFLTADAPSTSRMKAIEYYGDTELYKELNRKSNKAKTRKSYYFNDDVILSILAYCDISFIFKHSKVVSRRFRDIADLEIARIISTAHIIDVRAPGSLSLLPSIIEGPSHEIFIRDISFTNDMQIPWDRVAEFLCGKIVGRAEGSRQLLIGTTNTPNRDVIIEKIRQAFLDSETTSDFIFMWTHWDLEHWPTIFIRPSEIYDVLNPETNQRLNVFSEYSQFRLYTEPPNDNHLDDFALT